jgi:hypothetical protein
VSWQLCLVPLRPFGLGGPFELEGFTRTRPSFGRDYTLHATPSPAHPSHRLFPLLRLYHLDLVDSSASSSSPALRPFLLTLSGQRDTVSASNELSVRESLVELCDIIHTRTDATLQRLIALQDGRFDGWDEAIGMVNTLWKVEKAVAGLVKASVGTGVVF